VCIVPDLSTIIFAKRMTISENCIRYVDKNTERIPMRKTSKKTPRSQKLYHSPTKYHSPSKKTQKWSPRNSVQWGGGSPTNYRSPNGCKVFPRKRHNSKGPSKYDRTRAWNFNQIENIIEMKVLTDKIAKMLQEMNVFLIGEILKCIGNKKGIELMKTTQAVQAMGGLELPHSPQKLRILNRPRRTKRTVGGVFIQLAKEHIPKEQWKKITKESEKNKPKKIKRRLMTPRNKRVDPQKQKILFGTVSDPDVQETKTPQPQLPPKIDTTEEYTPKGCLDKEFQSVSVVPPKENKVLSPEKQSIGEVLYPKIHQQEPKYASKITGMFLDAMDNSSLSNIISRPEALQEMVKEALRVFKAATENHDEIGKNLYNLIEKNLEPEKSDLTAKITGMLLEMEKETLQYVLNSPEALTMKIRNSIEVLREEKRMIGNKLYPLVKNFTTEHAPKVTGMLLELDVNDLVFLLNSQENLKQKVEESILILNSIEDERKEIGNQLYPKVEKFTTEYAPKVTGMLLELDVNDVRSLLKSPKPLKEKVDECLSILGRVNLVDNGKFVSPYKKLNIV